MSTSISPASVGGDLELGAGVGRVRPQRRLVALPACAEPGERGLGQRRLLVAQQPSRQGARAAGVCPHVRGEDVLGPGLDAHAAEARVDDAEPPARRVDAQAEVVRVQLVEGALRADEELALGLRAPRLAPAAQGLGELEGAVDHALRVEPAVGGEVDVLEEDTDERRRNRRAGTAEVQHDGVRSPLGRPGRARAQPRRESDRQHDAAARARRPPGDGHRLAF